jgi:hypothetical protein
MRVIAEQTPGWQKTIVRLNNIMLDFVQAADDEEGWVELIPVGRDANGALAPGDLERIENLTGLTIELNASDETLARYRAQLKQRYC